MSKYFKLVCYLLIGFVSFTVSSKIAISSTQSQFSDSVIVPNTDVLLAAHSTEFKKLKEPLVIATSDSDEDIDLDLYNNGVIDYLNLSVYSQTAPVSIYGSDDINSIFETEPLVVCEADSGCTYETNNEYNYYAVESDGIVDTRIINGTK